MRACFPIRFYCADVKEPMISEGQATPSFHTGGQWGELDAPVMAGVRAPARCLPPPWAQEGHAWEKNSSSVFYFYLFIFWLWTGTWVRIRSGLDPFYWFLIFHISSWCIDVFSWAGAMGCPIIKLCLHFSLTCTASFGSPAPTQLSWDKFLPFDPLHCPHDFPSPSLYLCRFLCYQLPAFCLKGYLGNSLPCVSWLVQRLSPKYLCILGISICDPYLSVEENTSFFSLSIQIS